MSGEARIRQRLAGWRAALPYAGHGAKKVLRGMIAELEAELAASRGPAPGGKALDRAVVTGAAPTPPAGREGEDSGRLQSDPKRAAVADPEPKPPEARREAVDGAGSSSETKARQPVPAVGQHPVDAGGAGGSPAPDFAGWRERRLALRRTGAEVKQFDGIVYVDGVRSDDPGLYP